MNLDIVSRAVELSAAGKHEAAFQLSVQFDRQQQNVFFKAIGFTSELDILYGRVLIGAYRIDKEKDPQAKGALMKIYDSLCAEIEILNTETAPRHEQPTAIQTVMRI